MKSRGKILQDNDNCLVGLHSPLTDGFPHHFPALLCRVTVGQYNPRSVPHEKIRCAVHFCMNLTVWCLLSTQALLETAETKHIWILHDTSQRSQCPQTLNKNHVYICNVCFCTVCNVGWYVLIDGLKDT